MVTPTQMCTLVREHVSSVSIRDSRGQIDARTYYAEYKGRIYVVADVGHILHRHRRSDTLFYFDIRNHAVCRHRKNTRKPYERKNVGQVCKIVCGNGNPLEVVFAEIVIDGTVERRYTRVKIGAGRISCRVDRSRARDGAEAALYRERKDKPQSRKRPQKAVYPPRRAAKDQPEQKHSQYYPRGRHTHIKELYKKFSHISPPYTNLSYGGSHQAPLCSASCAT